MSYSGVIDVTLHLHKFRNIDLFHQGLYNLRIRMYQNVNEKYETGGVVTTVSSNHKNNVKDAMTECVALYPYAVLPAEFEESDFTPDLPPNIISGRPEVYRIDNESSDKMVNQHHLYPPTIDDETQTFTSRTFLVRYCDEEIELNELIQWKFEADLCRRNALTAPIYLEIDLMFADPTSQSSSSSSTVHHCPVPHEERSIQYQSNNATLFTISNKQGEDLFTSRLKDGAAQLQTGTSSSQTVTIRSSKPEFIPVATQIYRIYNIASALSGLHEYYPVVFDEFHFSVCSLTLHSVLQDLRCRLRPNVIPCAYQPRHRMRRTTPTLVCNRSEASTNDSSKAKESPTSPPPSLPTSASPTLLPPVQSFSDFLRHGHRGLGIGGSSQVRITMELDKTSKMKNRKVMKNSALEKSKCPKLGQPTNESSPNSTEQRLGNVPNLILPKPDFLAASAVPGLPVRENISRCQELSSDLSSILRADTLHAEYLRMLIDSLVRLASAYRALTCRCLGPRERKANAAFLDIKSIELPGGALIYLPGALEETHSQSGFDTESELPPKAFGGTTPRGSGSSYFAAEDLLNLKVHISHEAIQEEIERLEEEDSLIQQGSATSEKNEVSSKVTTPVDIRAQIPKLSARLSSNETSAMATIMTQDFSMIAYQIADLWLRLMAVLPNIGSDVEVLLKGLYERRMVERWREAIFRETCQTQDVTSPSEKAVWDTHQRVADHLRKSQHFLQLEPLPFADIFLPTDCQPVLFEQRYIKEKADLIKSKFNSFLTFPRPLPSSIKGYRGLHLFVLVHGFQGNSYDMRLLKNTISMTYPSALFICSSSNEDDTESNIELMGQKLANEVKNFISEWCPGDTLSRLSFICHSLGGIIARSALEHLSSFKSKFYTFLTLSSPHLGYMYNSNKLVDAGIWVLKKWKKSQSLQQLTLSDTKSVKDSFLFSLANSSAALGQFEYVCLMSSYQDQYVPFESARMELSTRAEGDVKMGPIYAEMARNATRFIPVNRLIRLDVNFKIIEKNLDTLIGRAAHIMFLENQVLMKMLIYAYPHFFR